MKMPIQQPSTTRIATSPPGRGLRPRPERVVNLDYVRRILEANRLTVRDEALLKQLDSLTILSSRQIKRLFWPNTSASNMHRRLRALYDMHLLDRTRMLTKSEGIIYTLGRAGIIWLRGEMRGATPPMVNTLTLRHEWTVSEFLVTLTEEIRRVKYSVILDWYSETQSRVIDRDRILLSPDGRIIIRAGDSKAEFYLEIDMNTERRAAIQKKLDGYYRAHRRGLLRANNVVFIAPTAWRAETLIKVAAEYKPSGGATDIFFVGGTLSEMAERGIFQGARWRAAQKNELQRTLLTPPWEEAKR